MIKIYDTELDEIEVEIDEDGWTVIRDESGEIACRSRCLEGYEIKLDLSQLIDD